MFETGEVDGSCQFQIGPTSIGCDHIHDSPTGIISHHLAQDERNQRRGSSRSGLRLSAGKRGNLGRSVDCCIVWVAFRRCIAARTLSLERFQVRTPHHWASTTQTTTKSLPLPQEASRIHHVDMSKLSTRPCILFCAFLPIIRDCPISPGTVRSSGSQGPSKLCRVPPVWLRIPERASALVPGEWRCLTTRFRGADPRGS